MAQAPPVCQEGNSNGNGESDINFWPETGSDAPARTVADWALEYLGSMIFPIPIPPGTKGPKLKGWNELRVTPEQVPAIFPPGSNIGLILGSASALVDVDLDDEMARRVAPFVLPATGMRGSRSSYRDAGAPASHYFYSCEGAIKPQKFADHTKHSICEVRGDGQQTVVCPSAHPSGDRYIWEAYGAPSSVDLASLRDRVGLVSALARLSKCWPEKGTRHEAALALAGTLQREGWPIEAAQEVMGILAHVTGCDPHARDVRDSYARGAEIATTGASSLAGLLTGQPEECAGAVHALRACAPILGEKSRPGANPQPRPGPTSDPNADGRDDGKLGDPHAKRPEIHLSLDESLNIAAVIAGSETKADRACLFDMAGECVEIQPDDQYNQVVRRVKKFEFEAYLNSWFSFTSTNAKGETSYKKVTKELAGALFEMYSRGFRILAGVTDAPVLLSTGAIHMARGYDHATRLYLSDKSPDVIVPEQISQEQAQAAVDVLLEPFKEFPFVTPEDKSRALALVLTLVARRLVAQDGPMPMFVVRSVARRSGKGLLINTANLIAHGGQMAGGSLPYEDREWAIRLPVIHEAKHPAYHFDNAKNSGSFGSESLDVAVTSRKYVERILTTKNMTDGRAWDTVLCISGNQIKARDDAAARCVFINLDAKCENPGDREFSKPDGVLLRWVAENRARLLEAGLIILAGYIRHLLAGGRKVPNLRFGGFEGWAGLVCGSIAWTGLPDPLEGNAQAAASSDEEAEGTNALFEALEAAGFNDYASTGAIAQAADKTDQSSRALKFALASKWPTKFTMANAVNPVTLGLCLQKLAGRIVSGRCLETLRDQHTKNNTWRVVVK